MSRALIVFRVRSLSRIGRWSALSVALLGLLVSLSAPTEVGAYGGQQQDSGQFVIEPVFDNLPMTAAPVAPNAAQMQALAQALSESHGETPRGAIDPPRPAPNDPPIDAVADTPLAHEPTLQRLFFNQPYTGPAGLVSTVNEPSLGISGQTVFMCHNWYCANSANGGRTWTFVNPFTANNADGGFCCDQKVIYVPSHDLMIWVAQTIKSGTGPTDINRYRINILRGMSDTANATRYFYDFRSTIVVPTGQWLDYPDLQFSDNWLYLAFNRFSTQGTQPFQGATLVKLRLDNFRSGASLSGFFQNTNPQGSWRFTQGATDTMYAVERAGTGTLTVATWPEANNWPTFATTTTSGTINFGIAACPGPGGNGICGRVDTRFTAAFIMKSTNEIVAMSASGPVTGRPNTFIRTHRIDIATPANVIDEDFWSSGGGVVYPSGSGNTRGHAGGTFLWNDTTAFEARCSAFLVDDIYGSFNSASALTTVIQGTAGPFLNRSGDYLETREHPTYKNSYVSTCFAYTGTTTAVNRVVWHGRSRDFPSSVKGVGELEPTAGMLPTPALASELIANVAAALMPPNPLDSMLWPSTTQGGNR